jgi:hypothetical protein
MRHSDFHTGDRPCSPPGIGLALGAVIAPPPSRFVSYVSEGDYASNYFKKNICRGGKCKLSLRTYEIFCPSRGAVLLRESVDPRWDASLALKLLRTSDCSGAALIKFTLTGCFACQKGGAE